MTAEAANERRADRQWPVISALGLTQIMAWGSSYYLPAVLAAPIAADMGWPLSWVVGGLSLGLLAAGSVSPLAGRAIAWHGGRPVLAVSACLLAGGLLLLSVAHALPVFCAAWLVIGFGMGAGLYDPAFAALGRLYGRDARSAITALTLFGSFASTVCWPLSAFLVTHAGWRGACLFYAVVQLAVSLPVYLFGLPREPRIAVNAALPVLPASQPDRLNVPGPAVFPLLACSVTLARMLSAIFSVHLLTVLQGKGVALAAAVGLGALVGPSQVAARAIEMMIARHHHPIWTKVFSVTMLAIGLALLWAGGPLLIAALVCYGAGVGLESIARGTLPLAVFGPERYPVLMGRIALPNLIAQATAPAIGATLLSALGLDAALVVLFLAAVFNVGLVACLVVALKLRGQVTV